MARAPLAPAVGEGPSPCCRSRHQGGGQLHHSVPTHDRVERDPLLCPLLPAALRRDLQPARTPRCSLWPAAGFSRDHASVATRWRRHGWGVRRLAAHATEVRGCGGGDAQRRRRRCSDSSGRVGGGGQRPLRLARAALPPPARRLLHARTTRPVARRTARRPAHPERVRRHARGGGGATGGPLPRGTAAAEAVSRQEGCLRLGACPPWRGACFARLRRGALLPAARGGPACPETARGLRVQARALPQSRRRGGRALPRRHTWPQPQPRLPGQLARGAPVRPRRGGGDQAAARPRRAASLRRSPRARQQARLLPLRERVAVRTAGGECALRKARGAQQPVGRLQRVRLFGAEHVPQGPP
mmetsp:Transcript_23086/g.76574  ORF Transcript_23086/g.76574 Transcript_23086/m.76574 type:complete len:358 (-) Transcript_23086:449-1522(-)